MPAVTETQLPQLTDWQLVLQLAQMIIGRAIQPRTLLPTITQHTVSSRGKDGIMGGGSRAQPCHADMQVVAVAASSNPTNHMTCRSSKRGSIAVLQIAQHTDDAHAAHKNTHTAYMRTAGVRVTVSGRAHTVASTQLQLIGHECKQSVPPIKCPHTPLSNNQPSGVGRCCLKPDGSYMEATPGSSLGLSWAVSI